MFRPASDPYTTLFFGFFFSQSLRFSVLKAPREALMLHFSNKTYALAISLTLCDIQEKFDSSFARYEKTVILQYIFYNSLKSLKHGQNTNVR